MINPPEPTKRAAREMEGNEQTRHMKASPMRSNQPDTPPDELPHLANRWSEENRPDHPPSER